MFEITVISHFSGAHQLRHLHDHCEKLHGHNWKIEVSVTSDHLGKGGVVIDFKILKQKVDKVIELLDHSYLNDLPFFSKREPSSENIAKFIFDRMKREFKSYPIALKKVTAWESETACATYLGKQE
jgi:6-pyruvoyltetrahydropterin/6-carboxytetrahydropterin synthase